MDEESSTKFMGSLTKFLQSLCNGYVEFEDGVELIGHIYLSVDAGKTGKKLNYFLNEKVCKNDNSVTFISNSFHAQPEGKAKGQSGKDGEGKKDDEVSETSESVPKSTNAGTVPLRTPMSSRSAPSPNQSRSGVQTGTKRPGSPLSAPTPPSQRRMQSSVKSSVGSPVSKTVPSSPSSSSQDNIPSPSPARKNRSEISQPPSNQSDNASIDNESDIVPSNIMTINPPPDFASFIGSLTSDNQTSRDQRSPPDMKPDTDVTFIKEEFVSEPSSCAQTGSSGQSGRSGDDLYPVMLHQNTSVFPSTSSAYPSATATSQHPGFPGASTSQSDPFNPQDGADPSVYFGDLWPQSAVGCTSSGDQAKSTKTMESTRYAVHLFKEYLQAHGKSVNFEGMDATELNLTLADFYANVRNRHGVVYSKNSLMAIRQGLRRHLQSAPFFRDFDIVNDPRFMEANNAIRIAMKISELQRVKPNPPASAVALPDINSFQRTGSVVDIRINK
ncbi:uncharacterized protein LOC143293577 isoform X7 [Babylonia areolata]|uniref:uncharacterized protein LOC143293577 isoform X7 n=1 Tax=Babylonia areolata TaxID=304850 RepID=UPI003FD0EBF9